jgi:multisubunit Na+/H+ antiporter MnhC subunit
MRYELLDGDDTRHLDCGWNLPGAIARFTALCHRLVCIGQRDKSFGFFCRATEYASPPIIRDGETILNAAANPLPQALVLTAIVIGFALLCFSLVLIIRLVQLARTRDSDQLRSAEPVATDALKPPLSED